MAIRAYRKTLADPEVQYMMHLREKAERIEAGRLADAIEHSLAEGKIEGKIEAAQQLLKSGMPREEIARRLEIPTDSF